jgi:hypothetical protein
MALPSLVSMLSKVANLSAGHPAQRAIAAAISSNDPFRTPHEVCDGMTLPARQAAQKSWRGLDGHHQLPRIIELKFADGLGVTAKPNRPSARNRRRMIHQAVTKISRCSGLLTGLSAWQSTDKPRWSTLLAGEQIPLSSHGGAL